MEISEVDLGDGQVRVQPLYFSVDPYLRGRMTDSPSYIASFGLGDPICSMGVGRVLESRAPGFDVGDLIHGEFPWAESIVAEASSLFRLPSDTSVPASAYLGVLGLTGFTAYVGLVLLGDIRSDDDVFVTAAAGAVGSMVGQLAKIHGARVVGSAGSQSKVEVLARLGFDAGFDYHAHDLSDAFTSAFPHGISLYFDNVGGSQLEAALHQMKAFGRIIACGAISQYNATELPPGPRGFEGIVVKRRLKVQGFLIIDHFSHYEDYLTKAIGWLREGRLQSLETIERGFESLPHAFLSLFAGENVGKLLVSVE